MKTIDISSVKCSSCGLPNGEAVQPCIHCRVGPRKKDLQRRDAEAAEPQIAESKGEGEERSVWRFLRRGER